VLALVLATRHKFSVILNCFTFEFVVLSVVGTCLSFMSQLFNQRAVCVWMPSRCVNMPTWT